MVSHALEILRQGIWASLTGGWFYTPRQNVLGNTIQLYLWIFLLILPFYLYLMSSMNAYVWILYSILLTTILVTIKILNYRLHYMFDNSDMIQEQNEVFCMKHDKDISRESTTYDKSSTHGETLQGFEMVSIDRGRSSLLSPVQCSSRSSVIDRKEARCRNVAITPADSMEYINKLIAARNTGSDLKLNISHKDSLGPYDIVTIHTRSADTALSMDHEKRSDETPSKIVQSSPNLKNTDTQMPIDKTMKVFPAHNSENVKLEGPQSTDIPVSIGQATSVINVCDSSQFREKLVSNFPNRGGIKRTCSSVDGHLYGHDCYAIISKKHVRKYSLPVEISCTDMARKLSDFHKDSITEGTHKDDDHTSVDTDNLTIGISHWADDLPDELRSVESESEITTSVILSEEAKVSEELAKYRQSKIHNSRRKLRHANMAPNEYPRRLNPESREDNTTCFGVVSRHTHNKLILEPFEAQSLANNKDITEKLGDETTSVVSVGSGESSTIDTTLSYDPIWGQHDNRAMEISIRTDASEEVESNQSSVIWFDELFVSGSDSSVSPRSRSPSYGDSSSTVTSEIEVIDHLTCSTPTKIEPGMASPHGQGAISKCRSHKANKTEVKLEERRREDDNGELSRRLLDILRIIDSTECEAELRKKEKSTD